MSRKQHELGVAAQRQTARARDGWNWMLDEQPLLLGLAGMALGALAGGGLPPSRSEDALFGEARDEAMAAAAEKSRDAAEHARERAEGTRVRAETETAEDPRAERDTIRDTRPPAEAEPTEEKRADSQPPFPPHV
jgi:hypothetical protein